MGNENVFRALGTTNNKARTGNIDDHVLAASWATEVDIHRPRLSLP